MIIYQKAKVYQQRTGELMGFEFIPDHERCDLTGVKMERSFDWECRVVLDYATKDPCFGSSGDEYEFKEDFEVDMHVFLSEPYVVCSDPTVTGVEIPSFEAAWSQLLEGRSISLGLRAARVSTARALLENGEIEPWQLGTVNEFELPEEE